MMVRLLVRSVMSVLLAGGVLAACAGDAVTVPALSPPSSSVKDLASLKRGLAKPTAATERAFSGTTCATHTTISNSGVFGPAGGTLVFGTSSLIIPGGALRDTVTITATSRGGESSRVELEPHGLQFAMSAGLLLDTSGCAIDDVNAPSVVYLNELGEIVEVLKAVFDPRWQTIAAPIDHFSGYAIAF